VAALGRSSIIKSDCNNGIGGGNGKKNINDGIDVNVDIQAKGKES
jgi:hypothetical protein